jgi:hypothetical protein
MMALARSGLAVVGLLLAGCAARPPSPPVSIQVAPESASHVRAAAGLEQTLQARARTFRDARRWADAVVQWELLTLLRPQSKDYQVGLESARAAARDAAAEHLREADAARARRNADQAVLGYLRALAAEPSNQTAAAALKALEAEKVGKAWLNRPPRVPYTPPGQAPGASTTAPDSAPKP